MALCSKAKELLRELQRSDWLPPYNDELVRQVVEEVGVLHEQILEKLRHARLDKIKNLRWETGTIIPAHLAANMSQKETQFFHGYDQLLTDYMADFELDLTADATPPKDLFVEVRVLKDCGEIMTENGLVNLEVNSTHFLRRVDVEQLIRQGLLEQIKH
ncbi:hypothetical protein P43SY_006095 [Pythium insidiosum]|uniref:DNA replication complex GINS protein PSF1 n=1 Tax=Pythium insidiosum TaxID=114742 RepID=A0AAD5Q9X2_PYTIN|nr:hypothetical protein P43SY_006095 [Pythium insidiosum]